MDFDTENFISEVQKRPAIWNTKCPEYLDKDIKQSEWDELVDIYGAELPLEEKKLLADNLHKKWRNIRDCFVKTHKAKKMKSGSAAKKKVQYAFYNNLLFLKDTVNFNTTSTILRRSERKTVENTDSDSETTDRSMKPKRNKKNKNVDHFGRELIGILNKNLEQKFEMDEDRLFFLSLVKEFKNVPENLQIQTKLNLLKVIQDAQIIKFESTS